MSEHAVLGVTSAVPIMPYLGTVVNLGISSSALAFKPKGNVLVTLLSVILPRRKNVALIGCGIGKDSQVD